MVNYLKKNEKAISCLIVLLAIAINIWHLNRGFSSRDSSFFVAMAYRFAQGDMPIIHEWHPAQMPAVLLIPFVKLYLTVFGTSEGIVLYFRIIYTFVINGLLCLAVFLKFRQYGYLPVSAIVFILMMFTMGGECIPNYNTLGITFFLLFSILFTQEALKWNLSIYFSGVFFAALVLCCPYMALAYLGFSIIALVQKYRNKSNYFSSRWLLFTLGCLTLAVLVTGYMLMGASLSEYISSVGYVFDDPEHVTTKFTWIIKTFKLLKAVWRQTKLTIICIPFYVVAVVLFIARRSLLNDRNWLKIFILLSCALIVAYRDSVHNFAMVIFLPLGFVISCLDKDYNRTLMNMVYLDIVYIFMINLTSDTVLNASSMASMGAMVPVILMLSDYIKRHQQAFLSSGDRFIQYSVILMFCLFDIFLISDRITRMYQETNLLKVNTIIQEGPLKGLLSTEEKVEKYERQLESLTSAVNPDEKILAFGDNPWPYLVDGVKCGSYSVWFKENRKYDITRLFTFYELNEDNIPSLIFIMDDKLDLKTEAIEEVKNFNANAKIVEVLID